MQQKAIFANLGVDHPLNPAYDAHQPSLVLNRPLSAYSDIEWTVAVICKNTGSYISDSESMKGIPQQKERRDVVDDVASLFAITRAR